MEFLTWLEKSALSQWVNESGSLLGYPAILFLHTIGLATVAGVNAGINLRLIGFAPRIPLAPLVRFFPLMWTGFGVTAFSGTLLLMAGATTKLTQPVFYLKMLFVAAAVVNLTLLKNRVFGNPEVDTRPLPQRAKVLAVTSLFFWLAATTAGRLMAYL